MHRVYRMYWILVNNQIQSTYSVLPSTSSVLKVHLILRIFHTNQPLLGTFLVKDLCKCTSAFLQEVEAHPLFSLFFFWLCNLMHSFSTVFQRTSSSSEFSAAFASAAAAAAAASNICQKDLLVQLHPEAKIRFKPKSKTKFQFNTSDSDTEISRHQYSNSRIALLRRHFIKQHCLVRQKLWRW